MIRSSILYLWQGFFKFNKITNDAIVMSSGKLYPKISCNISQCVSLAVFPQEKKGKIKLLGQSNNII